MATGDTTSNLSFAQKLAKEATVDWTTLSKAIQEAYKTSVEINRTFGQGQERLSELMGAVSDAIPRISRLGGSVKNVQETMQGVAEASRRNVIANTEDVEKLYAATQVVGGSAESLSNAFLDVGVGIEQVGKQLEGSVNYVRSIGGNTKAVMKDVADNMSQMNRFQFEGGVQGLTKMAAQASMLRFNMNETFKLADKVLDPDGAVEVAAAFQRLGVSAGDLADPFQLMNQSINDPSGLQNSLADVAKQFTYFDDKTKTFKINPQGVLTLREMEKQTGVSAAEMSKMGLAAAELDQRLSAVNMAGLNIKEDDKQYLANIAKMGEGGDYEVKLTNEKGDEYTKKLSDVTQTEMDKLIKEQKEGPKTLEEIARSQLTIDEAMLADIRGMREALVQGITSPKQIRQGIAGAQRLSKSTLGEASDTFKAKDFRDISEGFITAMGGVATKIAEGNKPLSSVVSSGLSDLGDIYTKSQEKFTAAIQTLGEKIAQKTTDRTPIEKFAKEKMTNAVESYGGNTKNVNSSPINSSNSSRENILQNNNNTNTTAQTTNSKVDVSGKIEIDVKAPMGVSTEEVKKLMDSTLNGVAFQDYMSRLASPKDLKEPVSKTYSA